MFSAERIAANLTMTLSIVIKGARRLEIKLVREGEKAKVK